MIIFARLQEDTTDEGPWKRLSDKNNASTMQKHIVPWLIAMYGLSYSKTVATNVVKQMIIALCEKHEYLDCRRRRRLKILWPMTPYNMSCMLPVCPYLLIRI
jgi:hypothetical protein